MFSKRTDWKLTPNAFTAAQQDMRAAGSELLDLTASNPTRVGLNYDAEAILGSLAQAEALDYDPQPKGLLAARKAVSHYYREQHDTYDVDPENILLTTSTSEAYSHIFRLICNAQDE
ncbi:MAG TPA: pyridoxal phosphate-dependent aminotransferase, partial [Terriglobales bacterium]